MAATSQPVESDLKIIWVIQNFRTFLYLRDLVIWSTPFSVKCVEMVNLYFGLVLVVDEGDPFDFNVYLVLIRHSEHDELDDIEVKFELFVEDIEGGLHLVAVSPFTIFKRLDNKLVMKEHIDNGKCLIDYLSEGNLRLRIGLSLRVDPVKTAGFNCSPQLKNLSRDIKNHYYNGHPTESVLRFGRHKFNVHLCMLDARWPNFCEFSEKFVSLRQPKIPVLSLICAVVRETLPRIKTGADFQEKVFEINGILTRSLLNILLHYLYTGEIETTVVENCEVNLHLIRLSLFFNLKRVVEKFESAPVVFSCSTNIPFDCYTIEWSREDSNDWIRNNFLPFTQIIQPRKPGSAALGLKFDTSSLQEIIVRICFLEGGHPFYVRCLIKVKDHYSGKTHAKNYSFYCKVGEVHTVETGIRKVDLTECPFTINFTLYYPQKSTTVKKEYALTSANSIPNTSLFLYSQEIRKLLDDKRYCDLAIDAGRKFVEVHRFILCARSSKFREDLQERLLDRGRINLELTGISFEVLQTLVTFMYSGTADIAHFRYLEYLRSAAEEYRVLDLKDMCQKENLLEQRRSSNADPEVNYEADDSKSTE